jgi:hypothetical protein
MMVAKEESREISNDVMTKNTCPKSVHLSILTPSFIESQQHQSKYNYASKDLRVSKPT